MTDLQELSQKKPSQASICALKHGDIAIFATRFEENCTLYNFIHVSFLLFSVP
ncbi:hypothetical protein [uncultured Tateyamaria sp.]|uniref:hypothetical protein n=1 Tax=uncultured Tateyamaria sp. TaxID=455651 RepID=UPI0026381EFD|nr:hypothetical protein [uncultured Tateyamaria sp.]